MGAKAWVVQPSSDGYDNDDMGAHVVHAPNRNKARAAGSGLCNLDYTEVTARRAKKFDGLSGPDLSRAQLADGWTLPCDGCSARLTDDESDEDGDPSKYVFRGPWVYCSARCCIARLREYRQFRINEWETVRDACEKWPGIEIVSCSGLTFGEEKHRNSVVGSVRFRFPGGTGTAFWVRHSSSLKVESRDLAAWEMFAAECDGRSP